MGTSVMQSHGLIAAGCVQLPVATFFLSAETQMRRKSVSCLSAEPFFSSPPLLRS